MQLDALPRQLLGAARCAAAAALLPLRPASGCLTRQFAHPGTHPCAPPLPQITHRGLEGADVREGSVVSRLQHAERAWWSQPAVSGCLQGAAALRQRMYAAGEPSTRAALSHSCTLLPPPLPAAVHLHPVPVLAAAHHPEGAQPGHGPRVPGAQQGGRQSGAEEAGEEGGSGRGWRVPSSVPLT